MRKRIGSIVLAAALFCVWPPAAFAAHAAVAPANANGAFAAAADRALPEAAAADPAARAAAPAGAEAAAPSVIGGPAGPGLRFAGDGTRTGMIDDEGNVVIPFLYNGLSQFKNGYACGYIDEIAADGSGRVITRVFDASGKVLKEKTGVFADYYDGEHSVLFRVSEMISAMGQEGARVYEYALGDGELEPVVAFGEYNSLNSLRLYEDLPDRVLAGKSVSDGDALRLRQKYGYLDLTGKIVTPLNYDEIRPANGAANGARIVCRITEEEMEIAGQMGLAATNHYGLLDTASGKELLPCDYADAWSQSSVYGDCPLFAFYKAPSSSEPGKWAFFDAGGKQLTEFVYDNVGSYRQGLIEVERDGKAGLLDETGNEAVPCAYSQISVAFDGTVRLLNFDEAGNTISDQTIENPYRKQGIAVYIDHYTVNGATPFDVENYWLYTDAPAFIQNGRTMLPLRALAEALGVTVLWDAETKTVDLYSASAHIALTVGSDSASVNRLDDGLPAETAALDAPAVIRGGRTYVPLRFAGEACGVKVEWRGDTRDVMISMDAQRFAIDKEAVASGAIQTGGPAGAAPAQPLTAAQLTGFVELFNSCGITTKDWTGEGYENLRSYTTLTLNLRDGGVWVFSADSYGNTLTTDPKGQSFALRLAALNEAIYKLAGL